MGIVYILGTLRGHDGHEERVRFLVDSGATYTLVPNDVWRRLSLLPRRMETFTFADGTTMQRSISECYIILPQGEGHTPVILGEPGDEALLGVITLEILGLILNPFTRQLQPMRMMLANAR